MLFCAGLAPGQQTFDVTNSESWASAIAEAAVDSANGCTDTINIENSFIGSVQQVINADVIINGNGSTINMNDSDRALFIAGGNVSISNLTIEGGEATGGYGWDGGGGGAGLGGAIFVGSGTYPMADGAGSVTGISAPNVTLTGVSFINNLATGGGAAAWSGAIVDPNLPQGGGGGMGGSGGRSSSDSSNGGGGGGGLGIAAAGGSPDGEPGPIDGTAGAFVNVPGSTSGGPGGDDGGLGGASGGGGGGGGDSSAGGGGGGGGVGGAGGHYQNPPQPDGAGDGGFGGGGGGSAYNGGKGGFGGGGGSGGGAAGGFNAGGGGFGGGGATFYNDSAAGGFGAGAGYPITSTGVGSGGGGLGAGGALFVMQGATVTLVQNGTGNLNFSGNSVAPGLASTDGSAYGADLFLGANVTFDVEGSGSVSVNSLGGAGNTSDPNVIANDPNAQGGIAKTGTGTLVLTGTSYYSGTTIINGGTLSLQAGAFEQGTSEVIVGQNPGDNATFVLGSGASINVGPSNTGTTIIAQAAGSVGTVIDGNGAGSSGAYVGSPVFAAGSGTATLIFNENFAAGSASDTNYPFYTTLTGSLNIIQNGPGTTILDPQHGENAFTGSIVINDGVLQAGSGSAMPSGNNINVNGGVLDMNGENVAPGMLLVDGGSVIDSAGGGSLNPSTIVAQSGTISVNIGGNADFLQNGPGTTLLSGSNSYSGNTFVDSGTLRLGSGHALPASTLLNVDGGALDLFGNNTTVNGLVLTGGSLINSDVTTIATLTAINGSQVSISGDSVLQAGLFVSDSFAPASAISFSSGSLVIQGLSNATTATAYLDAEHGFVIGSGGSATLQLINGQFGSLEGENLILGSSGGTGTLIFGNGAGSQGAWVQAPVITTGNGTGVMTFEQEYAPGSLSNTNYTFLTAIQGAINVNQDGPGTTILAPLNANGVNSYTGGTFVRGGTLAAASANSLGSGPVVVTAGTLVVQGGQAISNAVTLSGGSYNVQMNLGGSFAGIANARSDFNNGRATAASLLDGTSSSAITLDTTFSPNSGAANDGLRQSDVYSLGGIGNNDVFTLELSMTNVTADSILGWLDPTNNTWENAVDGSTGDVRMTFISGAYNPAEDDVLGYYGVNTGGDSVWAVINQTGNFSIVTVPEPSESLLLVIGGALMFLPALRRARSR